MTNHNNPRSLAMLITSMFMFGTIGLFRRAIPMSSAMIAFFRGAIGCLFLILFVKIQGKKIRHGLERRTLIKLVITGVMIGFNWILLFEAYNFTTVSVATLCYYMQPTFVIILASVVLHESLTARKMLCTVVSLIGMFLISGVAEAGGVSGTDLRGILLGLGAGCLYAMVVLTNKTIRNVDAYEKTIIQLGSAAVIMIPYLALTSSSIGEGWTAKTVALLVFVGIVHTGICYTLYFGSMDGLKTQSVAILSYIDPVTALILSALLLGERMSPLGIVGAVLILGSAIICEH